MTSVLNVDTIANKAGSGPVALTKQYAAKAWVNGDTDASILDSNNVSSSSDAATGQYIYNFTNNMSNALYAGSGTSEAGAVIFGLNGGSDKTTSSCKVRNVNHADTDSDQKHGFITHGDLA